MAVATYRRRIRITTAPGKARADIEDDAHRFGVALLHDGAKVTAIRGEGLRTPWTLCIDAAKQVERLIGMPLTPDPAAIYKYTNGTQQCTHAFDVAGLAIAHAYRGTPQRQYDIDVPYPVLSHDAPKTVTLHRDGQLVAEMERRGGSRHLAAALCGTRPCKHPALGQERSPRSRRLRSGSGGAPRDPYLRGQDHRSRSTQVCRRRRQLDGPLLGIPARARLCGMAHPGQYSRFQRRLG